MAGWGERYLVLAAGTVAVACSTGSADDDVAGRRSLALEGSQLRLQYHHGEDWSATNNEVKPHFRIHNDGTSPVPLSELTIRYYYTSEPGGGESSFCYWANIGCGNITRANVAMTDSQPGADHYFEVGFTSGIVEAGGDTGEMKLQFHSDSWANYDESDDFSYAAGQTSWADATNVALYRNGVLLWGTSPDCSGDGSCEVASGGSEGEGGSSAAGGSSAQNEPVSTGGEAGTTGSSVLRQFSITVPRALRPDEVLFAVTDSIDVDDGLVGNSASGAYATVANSGTGDTTIGASAHVGNVYAGGTVFLRSGAAVHGIARTAANILTQDTTASAVGAIEGVAPTFQTISWQVPFPLGGDLEEVRLEPDVTKELPPGDYSAVVVKPRAALHLEAGRYTFRSLTVESDAGLHLDESNGTIQVYVEQGFVFRGDITETGGSGGLLVGVYGTSPVHVESRFIGTIVAPAAEVNLATVSEPADEDGGDTPTAETETSAGEACPPYTHCGSFFAHRTVGHQHTRYRQLGWQGWGAGFGVGFALGQMCSSQAGCGAGLGCEVRGRGTCQAKEGEPCAIDGDCIQFERSDLPPLTCVAGTCLRVLGQLGSPCQTSGQCEPGFVCEAPSSVLPDARGTCQLPPDAVCVDDSDCAQQPCFRYECTRDFVFEPDTTCRVAEPLECPDVYVGDVSCSYGDPDCNPCVFDVEESFAAIGVRTPDGIAPTASPGHLLERDYEDPGYATILGQGLVDVAAWNFNADGNHFQSVQRVPGVLGNRVLALTQSTESAPGYLRLLFVKSYESEPLEQGGGPFWVPQVGVSAATYEIPDARHPGGAQVLGQTLFFGVDVSEGPGFVQPVDLSQLPTTVSFGERLYLDGSHQTYNPIAGRVLGEVNQPSSKASATAVARLYDGSTLLFVLGRVTNRAEDAHGWFYVRGANTTTWNWRSYFSSQANVRRPTSDGLEADYTVWDAAPQNINFVTECGTGNIYAIAGGNPHSSSERTWQMVQYAIAEGYSLLDPVADIFSSLFGDDEVDPGHERLHLYKLLTVPPDGTYAPVFVRVAWKELAPENYLTTCTLRAGSGVHVTPDGEMVVYCVPHGYSHGYETVGFEEYAQTY